METAGNTSEVEVVRGDLDPADAQRLRSFWESRTELSAQEADEALSRVVCLLRREGEIVGISWAYAAEVRLVGGRRFWIYRRLLDPTLADQDPALIDATFTALEAEFEAEGDSPIGLCILVADPEERRRRPELQWSDPQAIYAGYLPGGTQVRIAYFKHARIAPPLSSPGVSSAGREPRGGSGPAAGYRVELFAEQSHVSAQDVVELWTTEAGVIPDEAKRRVSELLVVATDVQGRLAGVCTTYLQRNEQLQAELWYTRVYVAKAHRRSGLALALAYVAREDRVERYRSGADRRGIGVLFEVQSEILQRFFPDAIWPRTQFAFIGDDEWGSHLRVYYFPGATAPEPEPDATES